MGIKKKKKLIKITPYFETFCICTLILNIHYKYPDQNHFDFQTIKITVETNGEVYFSNFDFSYTVRILD